MASLIVSAFLHATRSMDKRILRFLVNMLWKTSNRLVGAGAVCVRYWKDFDSCGVIPTVFHQWGEDTKSLLAELMSLDQVVIKFMPIEGMSENPPMHLGGSALYAFGLSPLGSPKCQLFVVLSADALEDVSHIRDESHRVSLDAVGLWGHVPSEGFPPPAAPGAREVATCIISLIVAKQGEDLSVIDLRNPRHVSECIHEVAQKLESFLRKPPTGSSHVLSAQLSAKKIVGLAGALKISMRSVDRLALLVPTQ